MKAQGLTKETILSVDVKERDFPDFRIGDTIEVAQIIQEGSKERIQMFAGDVIAIRKNGIATTFTVRRIGANNIGVEKVFPYYSEMINAIRLLKRGRIRRAKLYYLRDRVGKAARIREKIIKKDRKKTVADKKTIAVPKTPRSNQEAMKMQQVSY